MHELFDAYHGIKTRSSGYTTVRMAVQGSKSFEKFPKLSNFFLVRQCLFHS